jgi:hypothetical protein
MMSICFILLLLISILTPSYGQVTCAPGWFINGGKCYLRSSSRTWDQCNVFCSTSYPGATMLCVNNENENEFMRSSFSGWHWIGYTNMPPYGGGKGTQQFGWVTGCSSTYTNWAPDDTPGEEYASQHPQNGLWYDYSVALSLSCGCEYNPALTTTPSFRPTTAQSSGAVSE